MFRKYILPIILILILAAVDQYTKYLVIQNIELNSEIPLLGDVLVLGHIQNKGAAWGSLAGKTVLLLIITVVVAILLCRLYLKIINNDKFKIVRYCFIFVLGGAIGNLIDRVRLGYVTDFIYFKIINFPLFNFADICVTVSMFTLIILFVFKYKTEELEELF
ncbi:MAG: signal peptidase II [Eubacterium sp.]|nr:signal peptidase II [Eubacterium sp.]